MNIKILKIANIEKNDPQETPCTLPQDKQEDAVISNTLELADGDYVSAEDVSAQ
jgi:hypothetical protein